MAKKIETAERLIETIEAIVRSTILEEYNIGITMNPPHRKNEYRTWGPKNGAPTWPHFVILNTRILSAKQALKLEKELYGIITTNKKGILFKKYRGDTKYGKHTPSLGGLSQDNDNDYHIYVAWGNIGDN